LPPKAFSQLYSTPNSFSARFRPDPAGGAYSANQPPQLNFEEEVGKGKGKGRREKGKEGDKGEGGKGRKKEEKG